MAVNKKWRIEGLPIDASYCSAAKIILTERSDSLLLSIKAYLGDNSPENLHTIRIALRRLRYIMEIFYDCFNKKKFLNIYKSVEMLQDLSGSARDLDVMKENILSFSNEKHIKVPKKILTDIELKRGDLIQSLKLELMKFYHSGRLKYLYK